MLKLSTKGRYGVRLMLDLALNYNKGPVPLHDVCKRQGISEKYLWQLINPLKNAGLVRSTRGAHGGYVLAKPARQISLKDIMEVLEGSMCLVDCTVNPSMCKRSPACVSREVWKEVSLKMLNVLESFTLEQMVEKQNMRFKVLNYSI
ncbi:MAG: Rrf2 family transcriptional regulator [Candidatus Omnitrophota bacterium]